MASPAPETLRFSGFEVDSRTKELRRRGRPVKLPPQALRLLEFLASHPGQLVTREEIRQEIWSGDTFVDFEHGINKSIRQIRDALNDDAGKPKFIETIPRRGYRFIAGLEPAESAPAVAAPAEGAAGAAALTTPVPSPSVAEPSGTPGRRLLAGGTVLLAACVALLVFNGGGWRSRLLPRTASKPIESLAVLPLENLSNDPEQDYFAEGLTDEMITNLAKISALRVISRTSVMRYKGTKEPIPQIARELNVDALLEGTVTRDRGRVRITAQLIAAAPEKHLWAEQYEGDLSEVLALQDAVAKAVVQEIRVKLTAGERTLLDTPRAVDPEAYEAYLRGRYLWDISGERNLGKAREYFEQAIRKDPGYARAWAGLADTCGRLASWGALPLKEMAPVARAAAEKALGLDPKLAEAMVVLAAIKTNYEWDWAGAEQLYKRAIELNPNQGEAHAGYATYLAEVGRTREAVREAMRAREVEPLSGTHGINVVWKLYLDRQYAQAEVEDQRESQRELHYTGGYIIASVYLQTGRPREAIAALKKAADVWGRTAPELTFLAHGLGATGARAEAQKVLRELEGRKYVPPECLAIAYEGLGERERALEYFEKAYAEHSMNGWFLPDPRLDQIRKEPRFREIMRGMGLPVR